MLSCKLGHAFLTNNEGSANPTAIASNVHAILLCVDADKFSYEAGPPELTYGVNKLQRHPVYTENLAIKKDDAQAPARMTQNEVLGLRLANQYVSNSSLIRREGTMLQGSVIPVKLKVFKIQFLTSSRLFKISTSQQGFLS